MCGDEELDAERGVGEVRTDLSTDDRVLAVRHSSYLSDNLPEAENGGPEFDGAHPAAINVFARVADLKLHCCCGGRSSQVWSSPNGKRF